MSKDLRFELRLSAKTIAQIESLRDKWRLHDNSRPSQSEVVRLAIGVAAGELPEDTLSAMAIQKILGQRSAPAQNAKKAAPADDQPADRSIVLHRLMQPQDRVKLASLGWRLEGRIAIPPEDPEAERSGRLYIAAAHLEDKKS